MSNKPKSRAESRPAKDGDKAPLDDDSGLFRREMADAKPLPADARVPLPRRAIARARFARQDERDVLRESLDADADTSNLQSGDSLYFCRQHVGRRTMRKLARGNYSVQNEIDLHGMTADEARIRLQDFIQDSSLRGFTCVRVVHGKGLGSGDRGPVLKRNVDHWLRRWPEVLAFVSTRQVDGGTGAVYVLLDRS